mmetsp:Transcript_51539/g.104893  ORF Transcript_51539/g.104893 Transcript_51539/m.104893 type:complete len:355 (+) Transcript_51539:254-1318(+)
MRHKLDDISLGCLVASLEQFLVAVQSFHACKVSCAHADYDDTQRLGGGGHNGCFGRLHVVDHTVGDDEQDGVLLVGLRAVGGGGDGRGCAEKRAEKSRTREVDIIHAVLVCLHDSLHSMHLQPTPVDREAVLGRRHVAVRLTHLGAESVHWVHLVGVIGPKDLSHSLDGALVRVHLPTVRRVLEVQRVGHVWVTIRAREVNRSDQRDLAPIGDEIRERGAAQDRSGTCREVSRVHVGLLLGLLVQLNHRNARVRRTNHRMNRGLQLTHRVMLAIGIPIEDLHLEGSIDVSVAEGGHGDLHGGPDGVQCVVDLGALPHHSVGAVLVQPGDDEEGVGAAEEAVLVGEFKAAERGAE